MGFLSDSAVIIQIGFHNPAMSKTLAGGPAGRSTIYEVAATAGVSIKTVSRVMRNEAKVSAETRERVHQAMRSLDYVPHPAARSLASTVPTVIGLLTARPVDFQAARRGGEYRMYLQMGAMAAALPLGFGLRLVPADMAVEDTADALIAVARSGAVGGYLIAPPGAENRALLDRLVQADVAVAVVGTAHAPEGCAVATTDDRAAMRQLTQRVIALGHRRIAIIGGRPSWHAAAQRLAGCLDAFAGAGMAVDESLIASNAFDFEAGQAAARQLLARPDRPTVILACTDDSAAGTIGVAQEMGIAVPEALSVTGFDDFELARKMCPALTTVRQPVERLAELATRRLIGQLQPWRRDIAAQPLRVELSCDIVQRQSLAPPPAGHDS